MLQLAALGLIGAGVPWLAGCTQRPAAERLLVAGGERGGLYYEFASLLAGALTRYGVAATAQALESEASQDNIALLVDGGAELGLALADSAQHAAAVREGTVVALGRVYQNYFHCIVRRSSSIHSLQDLAGKVVGTGAPGAGTWLTGQRILEAAGLKRPGKTLTERRLGLNAGLAALEAGDIDVLMISGGIPIGSVAQMNASLGLRLLDLGLVLPTLRRAHPGLYDRVVVPANTYAGMDTVETIGVANLLLCRADLPNEVVSGTVRLLIEHASELVPSSSAGIQFLSPENLIATSGQPLHPAAAETYRRFHG